MFIRARVIEVISHPYILNDSNINKLMQDKDLKLTNSKNMNLIKDLPRNSIIAQIINDNSRVIALPFFSSHISLPLKPGENVWLFKEEIADGANTQDEVEFFWMSRIHGMNFYEDLNFTHDDRRFLKKYSDRRDGELSLKNEIKMLENNITLNSDIPVAQFNDGPIYNTTTGKIKDPSSRTGINTKSLNISGKYILEDVPRYTKNPGDFIIQGSNNTLIKLGSNFANSANEILNTVNTPFAYNNPNKYSGTIDIVAGRAAISKEYLNISELRGYKLNNRQIYVNKVSTKAYRNGYLSVLNEKNEFENMKDPKYFLGNNSENIGEGDPDFFTDISRIYISEKCNGDQLLNIKSIQNVTNATIPVKTSFQSTTDRGYIIAKSDEIRIIARGKVFNVTNNGSFNLNENSIYQNSGGSIRLIKEGDDNSTCHLILEQQGNVLLNGQKIVIGDEAKVKENGKGEQVFIGHGAKEPLVLGYFLKNKLENFMNEVCKALVLISKNLDEINTNFNQHTHPYAGVAGNTAPTPNLITKSLISPNPSSSIDYEKITEIALNQEEGQYGPIEGITNDVGSDTISSKIDQIMKIKSDLNEILSTLGRTL